MVTHQQRTCNPSVTPRANLQFGPVDGLNVGLARPAGASGVVRRERLGDPVATVRPEHGAILHATYGFPGSERDLRAGPLVCAGALSAAAARIKLMACLGAGLGRDGIAEAFAPDDA